MLKNFLIKNKDKIKGKTFARRGSEGQIIEEFHILGIGKKSIKYEGQNEDLYAFHDDADGKIIGRSIVKDMGVENPFWNKDIISKIYLQKKYCEKERAPNFAPIDGFCWSCGTQIYNHISKEEARSELITGCPHCHRSYCD